MSRRVRGIEFMCATGPPEMAGKVAPMETCCMLLPLFVAHKSWRSLWYLSCNLLLGLQPAVLSFHLLPLTGVCALRSVRVSVSVLLI